MLQMGDQSVMDQMHLRPWATEPLGWAESLKNPLPSHFMAKARRELRMKGKYQFSPSVSHLAD